MATAMTASPSKQHSKVKRPSCSRMLIRMLATRTRSDEAQTPREWCLTVLNNSLYCFWRSLQAAQVKHLSNSLLSGRGRNLLEGAEGFGHVETTMLEDQFCQSIYVRVRRVGPTWTIQSQS